MIIILVFEKITNIILCINASSVDPLKLDFSFYSIRFTYFFFHFGFCFVLFCVFHIDWFSLADGTIWPHFPFIYWRPLALNDVNTESCWSHSSVCSDDALWIRNKIISTFYFFLLYETIATCLSTIISCNTRVCGFMEFGFPVSFFLLLILSNINRKICERTSINPWSKREKNLERAT